MAAIDFPPGIIGGEGVYAAAIVPRLRDRGLALQILAPRAPDCEAHDAALGVPVHRVPVLGHNFVTRTLSFLDSTRAVLGDWRGDLVYALRPVARTSVPLVAHFHTTRAGQARAAWHSRAPIAALANALFVPAERAHARRAARVLGVNAAMRSELGCDTRPAGEFAVIANGIDPALFAPQGRAALPGRRLLFVGRLDPLKRIPDLLRAFALLAPRFADLELTIVGSGREHRAIRSRIDALGLPDRVRLLDPVSHAAMPAVYRAHDLLVLPSAYESFGLVALEAMACGTPAITSQACAALGQPMFPVGDVPALAALMERLLADRDALHALSLRSRQAALAHTWDAVADRLVEVLGEACGHAPSATR